jgi:hypothetical protein
MKIEKAEKYFLASSSNSWVAKSEKTFF